MKPRRFAMLIPIAALAGCAGGSTIRVAEDEADTGQPVALAPAPEPDTASRGAAAPAQATDSSSSTASSSTASSDGQGYAPYGNARTLEIRRIGQWTHTGIGEARRVVIRDANAWAEFWSEVGAGDRPDVDFTQTVVVAVATGERPSGGYEIAVDRVTQSEGELTIDVVETSPGPNCMTTGVVTRPVDVIVVLAQAPRSWSFLERKEIRGCR